MTFRCARGNVWILSADGVTSGSSLVLAVVQELEVISDLMGATGQRILRAIVDGERDPQVLAAMRDRRIKSSSSTIAASLEGTWREEHLFALKQALERYDFFDAQVSACEAAILATLKAPNPPEDPEDGDTGGSAHPQGKPEKANRTLHTSLRRMMGVDLTAIPTIGPETALVIASEIGQIPWGQAARSCSAHSGLWTLNRPGYQRWNFALSVSSSTRVRV